MWKFKFTEFVDFQGFLTPILRPPKGPVWKATLQGLIFNLVLNKNNDWVVSSVLRKKRGATRNRTEVSRNSKNQNLTC